jgi:hypothetical protein
MRSCPVIMLPSPVRETSILPTSSTVPMSLSGSAAGPSTWPTRMHQWTASLPGPPAPTGRRLSTIDPLDGGMAVSTRSILEPAAMEVW